MHPFPREILLRRLLPMARNIFERNGLKKTTLETLTPQIEQFRIRVNLVGSHDSGKTSLLGTLARPHLDILERSVFESADERTIAVDDRFTNYCLIVNVEEVTLNPALQNTLKKISGQQMPLAVIFTKTDVTSLQENQAIVKNVISEIARLMGYAPMAIATTSAKKKKITGFLDILDGFEANAEQVFEATIVCDFLSELGRARQHLMVLAAHDDQSVAHLQDDIDVLTTQMQACLHRQL